MTSSRADRRTTRHFAAARSLSAKLLLIAGSTLVALLLAELIFRLVAREQVGLHGMYTEDEAVGVALTPGFQGSMRTSEFDYSIAVNDLGMRDHPVAAKGAQIRRVLVIGDSFVFGTGVALADSLPKTLERRLSSFEELSPVEVFNGGVPGYSPFQELHALRRLAPAIEPDLVVLVFFVGDDWFGNAPRQAPQEARRGPRGWLEVNSALFRSFDRVVLSRLKARRQYDIHRKEPTEEFLNRMRHVLEILEEIRATAEAHGATLLVALNPRYTQTYDQAWGKASLVYRLSDEEYSPFQPNARFTEALEERGFWFIDLLAPLREEGARRALHFPIDGHWNPAGNDFVASILAETIRPRLMSSP